MKEVQLTWKHLRRNDMTPKEGRYYELVNRTGSTITVVVLRKGKLIHADTRQPVVAHEGDDLDFQPI